MTTNETNALIDAAEAHAEAYNDDDRDCIKADVMNAFYAGAAWQQGRAATLPAQKGKWVGSRRCWHCGKQLQAKLGGGYHFATIKDPLGNELRTHKDCVSRAVGKGYVEIKE